MKDEAAISRFECWTEMPLTYPVDLIDLLGIKPIEELQAEEPTPGKQCECPMDVILRRGCQCGGE